MINAYEVSSVEACGTDESCLIHVPVHFPRSRKGTMGVKRHLRDIYLLPQSIYRLLSCNRKCAIPIFLKIHFKLKKWNLKVVIYTVKWHFKNTTWSYIFELQLILFLCTITHCLIFFLLFYYVLYVMT